jgi:integrase
MLAKIIKRTVEGLAPKAWLWDTELKGFGARRQTDGIFYYLRYRLNGLQRTKSLGRHGHLTPDLARAQAKQRLGKIASGIDPFAEEATARAAETFGGELERYLEQQQGELKPRSFEEIKRHLAVYAGPLHRMRLGEINRRAIAVLLAEVEKKSGIVSRNRLRSSLSAFFTWIIQEGFIETNPVIGTRKIDEGGSRERVLTQTELVQLWAALGQSNSVPLGQYGDVVRLLILTGQRKNEIAALRWDEVDFDRAVITLPPARTKNNRTHELPLSPLALAILQRQPRRKGQEFVFPNRNGGRFVNWQEGRVRLDKAIAQSMSGKATKDHRGPWRLHDLRRTAVTGMAELGVLPHIVEAVVNHVSGHKAGVAGTYNRAKYADDMRNALCKWADYVESLAENSAVTSFQSSKSSVLVGSKSPSPAANTRTPNSTRYPSSTPTSPQHAQLQSSHRSQR